MNVNSGFRLHSHEVKYGSGSGQQSVTAYPEGDDPNSYWLVQGADMTECPQGECGRGQGAVLIPVQAHP